MQEYIKQKLIEDGVRDDSVFFEYIGRMRNMTELAAYIYEKSKGSPRFESKANELLELVTDIHEIRFDHFTALVEKDAVVDIFDRLADGSKYTDTAARLDKEIEDGLTELGLSLDNNQDIDALRILDQLKYKLQRLKGMDQHLYEMAKTRINRTFNETPSVTPPTHQGFSAINNPYSQPAQNIYGARPSQGVPDHRTFTTYSYRCATTS
ncbi:MAG: hypothetical protein IKK43_05130 [Clostridia bacterium]|nr:hypothetical protein [bacterium]MBR4111050.1 hypothetical protein [Clostridia bacterium]